MSSATPILFHPEALSGGNSATPQRKSLQNLDVIDNFLFTTLSSLPDVAEPFFRIILRSVFGYDFPEIKVTAQKVVQGWDTTLHGIRMDAFIETPTDEHGGRATIYNIEAESRKADKLSLPRRHRFYTGLYDVEHLPSSSSYDALPDFISIVILSYDPFGCGDMFYESRSHLMSHPGVTYDDGIRRIYLYADGALNADAIRAAGLGDGKNLQSVIKYMCHSKADNVSGDDTKEMNTLVSDVKARREVGVNYMRYWDYFASIKREAEEEGHATGLAKGLAEGLAEGRAETRLDDARFHITSSRRHGVSDDEILPDLTGHFRLSEEDALTLLRGEDILIRSAEPETAAVV